MTFDGLFFHWHSPYMLGLLVPWVYLIRRAWTQRRPGFVVNTIVYAKGLRHRNRLNRLPLILEALTGACLILALARPQQPLSQQPKTRSGVDIMVCVDVSGSMEAVDVPNADDMSESELLVRLDSGEYPTRLEAARREIITFIQRRRNDRLGLISFSGLSLSKCPPTLDHTFLLDQVKALKTGIMGNVSTNIAAPIASAVERLRESTAPRRVIILLTDGEHAEESSATPEQAAEAAAEFGVTIHCISIGSPDAYIKEEGFNQVRWQRISHFDPGTLRAIAKATGGVFLKAEDAEAMKDVLGKIDQLETTEAEAVEDIHYREWFQPFVWVAIILTLLNVVMAATLIVRIP